MNWVHIANTAACFVLLFYLLMAANHATRWRHKLPLIGMTVVVAMQGVDPLVEWIPDMAWPSAVLTVGLALVITLLRRPLWQMLREHME